MRIIKDLTHFRITKVNLLFLGISIVLFVFDQYLKFKTVTSFDQNEVVTVFNNLLNIGYIRNYGAAFSLFSGFKWLLILIAMIAIFAMGVAILKKQEPLIYLSLSLGMAGATGNLFDRLVHGYVIDYLQTPFLPVVGNTIFNIADVYLIIACLIFLIAEILKEKKKV